jgi:hypothetical protein
MDEAMKRALEELEILLQAKNINTTGIEIPEKKTLAQFLLELNLDPTKEK